MIMDSFDPGRGTPRLTRRRLLLLAGGAAGTGLLAASGVAHADLQGNQRETLPQAVAAVMAAAAPAAAAATDPLAGFRQATQTGFAPINSALTFGAPTDLASGWDGTLWAIDGKGAPHVYDPLGDSWQLHGTGIDGAALIEDQGPAVYFRGGEVFIADGQHSAQAIATVWPELPPSYQLGVQGAAWTTGKLALFRGGTYLTVPWPPAGSAEAAAAGTPTSAAETPTPAPGTPGPGAGTPTPAEQRPAATATRASDQGTPTPDAATPSTGGSAQAVGGASSARYHAALLPALAGAAAATSAPTATRTPAATATPPHAASPSATPTAGHPPTATPTPPATHTAVPTATPTPSLGPTASATPTPAASETAAPTDTPTPLATDTPVATETPTPEATPPSTAAPAALADYVAAPLSSILGWPQTASWQEGVLDGVYSQGGGVVLLIRGGEFVTVYTPDAEFVAVGGPTPLGQGADFASLPADWQATGFDAGFHAVFGPAAGAAYITKGAQAVIYRAIDRVQVGAEEATATPTPEGSGTPTASDTPETSPTAAASETPTAEGSPTAEASPTAAASPTQATPTRAATATTAPTSARSGTPPASTPLYHAAMAAATAMATSSAPMRAATATPTPRSAASPSATPTHAAAATASATPTVAATPTSATTPAPPSTPTAEATPTGEATATATLVATPSPSPTGTPAGSAAPMPLLGATPGLHYIAEIADAWPPSWHPRFQQAPSGRTSELWGATVEGHVVSFDGTTWTHQPGDASSLGVGVDGAVFAVGQQDPQQLSRWNGSGWSPIARHSSALAQVSVGNQDLVWARDSGNDVHQLSQGQLQPAAQVGSAAHLAANYDGTLWSCKGNDANTFRLASDLNAPPQAVPAAGSVQKVASTGFGAAHCLAAQNGTAQLYRYQSPYVFRTPGSYIPTTGDPIEQALGSVFLTMQSARDETGKPPPTYQVVALDAHTGQERSRSAAAPSGLRYTAPAFDPVHETVIVGLTTDYNATSPQPGRLLGLDARDLSQVRWSIALPNNLPLGPGRPTLQGTQLCVSDDFNTLVMYDTGAAPDATTPTYRWTYTFPSAPQDRHRLPPPVLANGTVYAAWWLWSTSYGFLQLWLWKLDPATGTGSQPALPFFYPGVDPTASAYWHTMGLVSPLLATLPVPGSQTGQHRQVLFVNGGTKVWEVDVDAVTAQSYDLPGSSTYAFSGFAFANGVLWFGDSANTLHGVDGQQMKAVPNTPASLGPSGAS
ncbi:MAG: hypothetical protein JO367_04615, partial [Actinobacteria bacterium]|nr:hypothetical protein [Actinomycetota bacterium]